MTLVQLQYFRAVCRHSNITKAAAELHITQPSISNAIKDLEEEFGIKLFYRLSKGLSLTEEGRILLEKAEEILAITGSLERQMRDLGSKKKEILIGVPPMIGTILFPYMFRRFHELYPDIRLSIVEHGSMQVRRLVADGTLDAAIAAFDKTADSDDFEHVKILETETQFCASENHRLAGKAAVTVDMLRDEPLVLFKDDSYQTNVAKRLLREVGAEANVILYSSQLTTIKELVANNVAASVLFRGVVDSGEGIVGISFEKPVITDIRLIWNRNKHLYTNLAKFIDFTRGYKHRVTYNHNT